MQQQLIYWKAFIQYVLGRFQSDKCSSVAAELTVTSLLALVPLTTVVFSLLALIPSFQDIGLQLQALMFEYFVPATGESVQNYLLEFVGKTKDMSSLGFLMLLLTALLMMRTIDISFNHIWQIKSNKSVLRTFLVYWAILTLGPIFLGASLLITSYLQTLPLLSNVVQQDNLLTSAALPMLMESIAFTLMFFVIPNRRILFKHAVVAALITALFFEWAKSGFGLFVEYLSTYQVIFGALATIPLFLIWIYLSWSIILLGAEICHGLFSFELDQKEQQQHPFIQLVHLLLLLADKQGKSEAISEGQLADQNDWGSREVNIIWLEKLAAAGLVAKLQDQSYCLKANYCNIAYQTIYEVAGRVIPSVELILASGLPSHMQKNIVALVTDLDQLLSKKLSV